MSGKEPFSNSCLQWEKKLADFHAHRLSPVHQAALEAHLASCRTCAAVLLEYRRMDEQIRQALVVQPLPKFTTDLLLDQQQGSQEQEVRIGGNPLFPEAGEARRQQPRLEQGMVSQSFLEEQARTLYWLLPGGWLRGELCHILFIQGYTIQEIAQILEFPDKIVAFSIRSAGQLTGGKQFWEGLPPRFLEEQARAFYRSLPDSRLRRELCRFLHAQRYTTQEVARILDLPHEVVVRLIDRRETDDDS